MKLAFNFKKKEASLQADVGMDNILKHENLILSRKWKLN